jgi:hypothetical protein
MHLAVEPKPPFSQPGSSHRFLFFDMVFFLGLNLVLGHIYLPCHSRSYWKGAKGPIAPDGRSLL